MIGYSSYSTFRQRPAYNRTIESTIILDRECLGKGFGRLIYTELIESARRHGFTEMIAVIALPNPESTLLHSRLGFIEAGVLKKVGYKFNRYLDIAFWQKSLT